MNVEDTEWRRMQDVALENAGCATVDEKIDSEGPDQVDTGFAVVVVNLVNRNATNLKVLEVDRRNAARRAGLPDLQILASEILRINDNRCDSDVPLKQGVDNLSGRR